MKGLRYYTEEEILIRIDRCAKRGVRTMKKVEGIDASIRVLRESPDPDARQINRLRLEQKAKLKYASRIDAEAKRLSAKLAELRTRILPWKGASADKLRASDVSVPR